MAPVIRIDDQVMDNLKRRAIDLGLIFGTPNDVLRGILGLDRKSAIEPVENVPDDVIDIELNPSCRQYVLLPLPKDKRRFFPGYKVNFELMTDVGVLTAHVTSAPKGTPIGDPDGGGHIRGGFGRWYAKHPELKAGDTLRVEALEPARRYRLSIV